MPDICECGCYKTLTRDKVCPICREDKNGKWISVKDRLPDQAKQTEVVFYENEYEWWTGMYTPKDCFDYPEGVFQYHQHWGDDDYHTIKNVKCWMPLPDPPKEDE